VARQLRMHGFDAAALLGGYDAWRAMYSVEPKGSGVVVAQRAQGGAGSGVSRPPQERTPTPPGHEDPGTT
jgi:hypothetical protein